MTKVRFLFATCQAPLSQPTDTFFSPKQTWGACSTRRLLPVCNIFCWEVEDQKKRVSPGTEVYRWGYTTCKCWQMLWGALQQVRVPRLRGCQEVGLLEKYQRHSLEEVLFALAVGGLSQRKVVGWVRRFLGSTLSPATLTRVLSEARQQVEARRQQSLSAGPFAALVVDGIHLRYRRRWSAPSPACRGWPWASAPTAPSRCWSGGRPRPRPPRPTSSCSLASGSAELIEITVTKAAKDRRPESYKLKQDGHQDTLRTAAHGERVAGKEGSRFPASGALPLLPAEAASPAGIPDPRRLSAQVY